MRGPRRRVESAHLKSGQWEMVLSCNHETVRRAKNRIGPYTGWVIGDPSNGRELSNPAWVYCADCKGETK